MSDKKDLYEDRYVLDDYDTPSFYGKSADKYFGDIDREHKENRRQKMRTSADREKRK